MYVVYVWFEAINWAVEMASMWYVYDMSPITVCYMYDMYNMAPVTWPVSKCVCAICIYAWYEPSIFIYLFIFYSFIFFGGVGGGVGVYDLLRNGAYAWYWLSRRASSEQVNSVCIWHMHDASPITQGVKIPCICYLYDLSPLTEQWL